jgi:hypothetical protein
VDAVQRFCLRQTVGHRAPLLLFPYFSPLTVTFPKLSVIWRPLYVGFDRMRTETDVMLHSFPGRESFLTPKFRSSKRTGVTQFAVTPPSPIRLRKEPALAPVSTPIS